MVALGVARFGVRIDRTLFLGAVAAFGVATIAFGLSTNPGVSFVALLAAGAFDSISVVIRQTLVQGWTPDHLRGRVAAINRVFISSSNELGALESGLLAALIGAVPSVVAGGMATLMIVGLSWKAFPHLGAPQQESNR
jgi:MFS family permease